MGRLLCEYAPWLARCHPDLVGTDEQNDVFRPEGDACNSVANHVHVDELPLAGEGISTRDE